MTAIAHQPVLGARLLRTAARGAVLVGLAIIIGFILIEVVNGSGTPGSSAAHHAAGPTTGSTGATTTTTPSRQLKLAVFNGSGVSGAATAMANRLRGLGYAILFTGNAAATQTGTTVACKTGVSSSAADQLAKSAVMGATVQPFPNPPPTPAAAADCIVTVGK